MIKFVHIKIMLYICKTKERQTTSLKIKHYEKSIFKNYRSVIRIFFCAFLSCKHLRFNH